MKIPRKLKKNLKKKFSREILQKISHGELIYKAKLMSKLTENGWKTFYGPKMVFMKIEEF